MDKHNEESGCYDSKISEYECKICNCKINYKDLENCKQPNGDYICPACLHDTETEKLRKKMKRD